MGITQQQKLLSDVVRVLDSKLTRKLSQHPDSFAFSEGTGGVIPELLISDDSIQKSKALVILDGLIRVADDTEYFAGVRPNDCLPARNRNAVVSGERMQFDSVIQSGRFNGFRSCCRF